MWLIIIGAISILLLFIIFSRIIISFDIIYKKDEKLAVIYIYFYRINLYRKTIDFSGHNDIEKWDNLFNKFTTSQSVASIRKELNIMLKKVMETKGFFKQLLNKSKCKELTWHTYVGTGEASTTGVISGGVWILKGLFLGVISKQCLLLCQPQITVTPTFQQKHIHTHFNCIVSLKVGQTILIFLK